MRPIIWGVISFFIGMVGWVSFSVIVGVGEGFGGKVSPMLLGLMYLFGTVFFFSLPSAIGMEIFYWRKNKKDQSLEKTLPKDTR